MSDGRLDFSDLDTQFGRALGRWADARLSEEERSWVVRLGMHLSMELGRQHSCVELFELDPADGWPAGDALRGALERSGLLAAPDRPAPLVLEGPRLYLARFHGYEELLSATLLERTGARLLSEADLESLAPRIAALFPGDDAPDWQRIAVASALDGKLAVIAGGPGTGKTTTVARMLLLLLEHASAPPVVRLAAPTGKAAARLTESMRIARGRLVADGLASEADVARLPEEASTLHRLLGYRPGDGSFRHDSMTPLDADLVVLDEASMVDLRMMAALASALRPESRLVLLGDPDQLSSVEAGRVLGDLCAWAERHGDAARFTKDGGSRLGRLAGADLDHLSDEGVPALADAVTILRRSRRFDVGGALGRFARAANLGDVRGALTCLDEDDPDLQRLAPANAAALLDAIVHGFGEMIRRAQGGAEPGEVLAAATHFQVLCASRHGPLGVERINALTEQALRRDGRIRELDAQFSGCPVMVTVNDYALGLFNGDVGVILRGESASARAWFPTADGGVRGLPVSRLPPHETAFAITVHKSQGSEFDRVLVALGDEEPRLLTRELLYTGVTRARVGALVCATDRAVEQAVTTRGARRSGLRDRLWPE